jgi:transposase
VLPIRETDRPAAMKLKPAINPNFQKKQFRYFLLQEVDGVRHVIVDHVRSQERIV